MIIAWAAHDIMVTFIHRGNRYTFPIREIKYRKGQIGLEYRSGRGHLTVATEVQVAGKDLLMDIIGGDDFDIEIAPVIPKRPAKTLLSCEKYNQMTIPRRTIGTRLLHKCKFIDIYSSIEAGETIVNQFPFEFELLVTGVQR